MTFLRPFLAPFCMSRYVAFFCSEGPAAAAAETPTFFYCWFFPLALWPTRASCWNLESRGSWISVCGTMKNALLGQRSRGCLRALYYGYCLWL